METMPAGRLHVESRRFAVEEVPVPVPGPGEALIEVRAAGVCLSDAHLIDGTLSPLHLEGEAVTLGHEVAGVIHATGPDVAEKWRPGTPVLLAAGQVCGECGGCRGRRGSCRKLLTRGVDYDGGWAQYALAREDTLVRLPEGLPFEQGAIIPDAVSTPYAAVVTTAGVRPAQAVGVWGVGGLGAHGVRLARLAGAVPVIAVDPLPEARQRALDFGADLAFDPADPGLAEAVRGATGGLGLDAAFDFAGVTAAREQAAGVLAPGGQLVLVGLTPEPLALPYSILFSYLGQQVKGHYGSAPEHLDQLVQLTAAGRLDLGPSISGRVPLAEAAEAVAALEGKNGAPVRLVLIP
ncbi:zinc-binding dehydrogenase [Streptomyces sp. DSM 44917]|uniref:Zinc-binding dehydrogenase n=1 Tax=Streptomyces boetiae TaxID=3075541 RepID=A0ABU2L2W3_9ACTN|nr:zinc-binding dehydrogenase [Streptomyces sp. DSM 44917]MDT0305894.1 zinc-binding dehydrogenase [Streptomyces sp. DSM 44917]